MMGLQTELLSIAEQGGFPALVLARSSGEEILRAGAVEDIAQTGLFKTLFGGESEIRNLASSLEGQLLPQVYRQGALRCVLSVTKDKNFVFGLFSHKFDLMTMYDQAEETARAIESLIEREGLR